MSIIINEKQMVEDNIFQFEERLKAPSSRFIDSTQTYVDYYHIDNEGTTTDAGFIDVASILGFRSPIKFKKIHDFPLYGIEQIVLSIQDADQGLDTEYTGEAIILPNTIKPLQNDYFVIKYLRDSYLFRVTDVNYDSVMADGFYRISYMLDFIDDEKFQELEKQVEESYECVLENIGTENNCIIESTVHVNLTEINKIYDEMVQTYLSIFYDERYNCVLGDLNKGRRLYDPYMTDFINRHHLFNKKNDLQTIILSEQIEDKFYKIKYEKSVYRFIERQDIDRIRKFTFSLYKGTMHPESAFYRWKDSSIEVVDVIDAFLENDAFLYGESIDIFSEDFVEMVQNNEEMNNDYGKLISKFIKKEKIELNEIGRKLEEELLDFNSSMEVFFFTPIILYIIRETIKSVIGVKK